MDYQPEAKKEEFRQFHLSLAPQTQLEGPGSVETVGEHSARRWVATTTVAGLGSFEIEAWISADLGERCASLERLFQARSALDPLYGEAERQILDLPGCMVRQIVQRRRENRGGSITETRVVGIREVPPEPGRYAPPEGYREIPVDQKIVGGIVQGQPLPSR